MAEATATPSLPAPSDPFGETLHLLRLTGTLYCRAELTAPWGVAIPALDGMMTFLIVTAGRCWLELDDSEPRLIERGSLTLIPHGSPHRFRSDKGARVEPLLDLPVVKVSDRYEILRHGGGGESTRAMYGVMRFDHVAGARLVELLPNVVQVDAWVDDEGSWIQSTLGLIAREATALRPGGETLITRLADVLVVLAIRAWLSSAPDADRGWLGALRDAYVGRALANIHRDPGRPWTVSTLAREVGMSRSAFSARFTDLVGESVFRYLTRWRMHLARVDLIETAESLGEVSARYGYQSDAAFCRAFRREFGTSPQRLRRDAAE